MKACPGFKELMRWQAEEMNAAIDEDKWYLSEEAGSDTGKKKAERHFTETHLPECAPKWREEFCGQLCEHRVGCELGKAMIERRSI